MQPPALPIDEQLLTNYNRPGRKLRSLKGIVVHWTANTGRGANAQRNRDYFNNLRPQRDEFGRNRTIYASAHYIVDDRQIIRCLPDHEVGYHVGARSYKPVGEFIREEETGNSPNNYLIGIEMCVNSDGDWQKTYQHTVELTRWLLATHGLTVRQLWRHYDITGKDCPRMMLDEAPWQAFRKAVNTDPETGQPIVALLPQGTATVNALNVRSGNGTQYPVKRVLKKGDAVTIYDQLAPWLRIGDNLWVHSHYIDVQQLRYGQVEATALNVRTGPGTDHGRTGLVRQGEQVTIYETQGKWQRIGENQWVHGDYILPVTVQKGRVNTRSLNVRAGANTCHDIVDKLAEGELITVLREVDGWYALGQDRWVFGQYVDLFT